MLSKHLTLAFLIAAAPACLAAQDTLSVEQCRAMAVAAHPLQAQKTNAAQIAALQTASIRAAQLPRIGVGAQASYQSEVFGLPVESPLFKVPTVPKDQYRVNVDVAQRIWDGQSDRVRKAQYAAEQAVAEAQTDVDVFSIRETVTDLFFKTLLLQESAQILLTNQKDLENRLKQAEAAVKEGVMLRSQADQIQIQILKIAQQYAAVQADQRTLLELLGMWIGRENADFYLTKPTPVLSTGSTALRPEWHFFDVKTRQIEVLQQSVLLRKQPRVEAFAQGGWGNPNPFNFFEQGLFGIVGLRVQWTPFDWGVARRDQEVLDLQKRQLDVQRTSLQLRLDVQKRRDQGEMVKNQALYDQDQAIIELQQSILARADTQVKNGVMTMTDYLAQVNLLTQAQLTRATHELQILQAREMQIARGE